MLPVSGNLDDSAPPDGLNTTRSVWVIHLRLWEFVAVQLNGERSAQWLESSRQTTGAGLDDTEIASSRFILPWLDRRKVGVFRRVAGGGYDPDATPYPPI